MSLKSELKPIVIKRRAVGPSDVAISIKYAGICHSDIHTVREEWGPISYPLTPGHEIGTKPLWIFLKLIVYRKHHSIE